MLRKLRHQTSLGLLITVACAAATPALASSGGSLPWEGPLKTIQESITGPVAGFIGVAAVAISGGMLVFGGEFNDFGRRVMFIALVLGVLLSASSIVGLYGASGASIGIVEQADLGNAGVGA